MTIDFTLNRRMRFTKKKSDGRNFNTNIKTVFDRRTLRKRKLRKSRHNIPPLGREGKAIIPFRKS